MLPMMNSPLFAVQSVLNACETVDPETVVEIARRELSGVIAQLRRDHADDVGIGVPLEAGIDGPRLIDNPKAAHLEGIEVLGR